MKTPVRFCLLFLFLIGLISVWSCKEKAAPSPTPTPTTKSSAKDITKFSFAALSPAVDATIDAAAKTIKATVPATTDLTKLVPTITISDKATVSPASGVATDFSKEVSYTVTAEDGSTQVWKVNVTKPAVAQSCQLIAMTVNNTGGSVLNETFEYDTEKRLIKRTSKNPQLDLDTKIAYTYNSDGFLTEIVWERINSKIASNNFKRVSTYSYKNGRLVLQEIKQTANDGKVITGSSTYEYDSETSGKLKKVVYNDIVDGRQGYTFLFTNGILTIHTSPTNTKYDINAMGLITKSTPTSGTFLQEYTYDVNGQPIKEGYVGSNQLVKTYTIIKNKYDEFELLIRGQFYPGIFWLGQDTESVFNPKGFKGFPNFKIYASLYDTHTFLMKTYESGTDIRTYDYKVDANGNVTSFTISYPSGNPTTGTLTYKCN